MLHHDFARTRRYAGWSHYFAAVAFSLIGATAMAAEPEKQELKLGFIKLTDCAPLIVAYEKGFFEDEGLYVTLEAQANWKVLLDRVIDGSLDGAHMLPGQPLGAAAGVGQQAELVGVVGMGLNTLAVTIGNDVWSAMAPTLTRNGDVPAHPITAAKLKPVVTAWAEEGRQFTLGMVFPTSTHNYALRYWLAAGGIHPGYYSSSDMNGSTDGEVLLSVTPPPQMPATLGASTILGYSVGEPWNQQAVMKGIGVPVVTAAEIWSRMPEKVFGLRRDFADQNPETVTALIKAIIRAEQWLDADNGANRDELAHLLARPEYVGADYEVLVGPLTGHYQYELGDIRDMPQLNVYYRDFAGYPFTADAVWFLTQMRRWGQVGTAQSDAWYDETAKKVYRADLYRKAAAELMADGQMDAADLPADDAYSAGESRFIDGVSFDAHQPNAYLAQFPIGQQGGKQAAAEPQP